MLTNFSEQRKTIYVSKAILISSIMTAWLFIILGLCIDKITSNPLYIILVSGFMLTPLFTFLSIWENKAYIGFSCREAIRQHITIDEVLAKSKQINYELQYIVLLIVSILTILSKMWISQILWIPTLTVVSFVICFKSYKGISGYIRYHKMINFI